MMERKDKIIIALVLILLIGAFIGGRMSKKCTEIIEGEKTTVTIDTQVTQKTKKLHWVNPNIGGHIGPIKKALRIAYPGSKPDTLPDIQLSEPITPFSSDLMDRRWIMDSISSEGVGLTFEHLVQGNIIESKYTVKYPEIKINTVSSTTRTLFRKNAFGVGFIAMAGLQGPWYKSAEIAPVVGYRYDKFQFKAGFGLINKSAIIGVYREF